MLCSEFVRYIKISKQNQTKTKKKGSVMSKRAFLLVMVICLSVADVLAQVVIDPKFSDSDRTVISIAAQEWVQRYSLSREVKVTLFKGEVKEYPDGMKETNTEMALPGLVKIDPELVGVVEARKRELRNIVIHSMSHADQSDTVTKLKEPLVFADGVIVGFQGASIRVRLRDNTETFWRILEEAVCERNAALMGKYTVSSPAYFAVGKLAMEHFPKGVDIMPLVRKNDVPGLVALILKKKSGEVTFSDIDAVMQMYQKAWSNAR